MSNFEGRNEWIGIDSPGGFGYNQVMTSTEKEILRTLRGLLEERVHLYSLVAFGSRARGDATGESDYDVLVVLDGIADPSTERHRCADAIYSICWDHDAVVLCHFISRDRFEREQSPYLLNIRREGVPA